MTIYDISREVYDGSMNYPGDPEISIRSFEHDNARISRIALSSHSGTHIDAPYHYIDHGKTIDKIPVKSLFGEVIVIDLSSSYGSIGRHDLEGKLKGNKRVLIKTSFSGKREFNENYPHLTKEAALYLVESGVVMAGIDSPSFESFSGDGAVHRELLSKEIVLIELLDLSIIPEGQYSICALPLRLKGIDGSPARVILKTLDE